MPIWGGNDNSGGFRFDRMWNSEYNRLLLSKDLVNSASAASDLKRAMEENTKTIKEVFKNQSSANAKIINQKDNEISELRAELNQMKDDLQMLKDTLQFSNASTKIKNKEVVGGVPLNDANEKVYQNTPNNLVKINFTNNK